MKKLLSFLLALCLLAVCLPLSVAAEAEPIVLTESGVKSVPALSMQAIADLMKKSDTDAPVTYKKMKTEASYTAPYGPGKLTDEYLQHSLNRLNALRAIAKVPAVKLDSKCVELAQYACLGNKTTGTISSDPHHPTLPADMPADMAKLCADGAAGSNLGWGMEPRLPREVNGWVSDTTNAASGSVGHRNKCLSPGANTVGFGQVKEWTAMYTGVVGDSTTPDYDFIAWPPSGNMPLNAFDGGMVWSVSLSKARVSSSGAKVKLTRVSDGAVFTMDSSSPSPVNNNQEPSFAAGGSLIRFSPGRNNVPKKDYMTLPGVWNVEITGIDYDVTDANGALLETRPAVIRYTVNIFDQKNIPACTHNWGEWTPTGNGSEESRACTLCGETQTRDPENPFKDVHTKDYFYNPVKWAVENGITSGTGATTFSPDSSCTRAQAVTFLWRAAGKPEPAAAVNPFKDVKQSDYYYKAVLWAAENNITAGTSETQFSPNKTCNRAQIVTFQYRAAGKPDVTGSSAFKDVQAGAYYSNAVQWAVEKGITKGTSDTTFSPNDKCTRGQIVTFLYRGRN